MTATRRLAAILAVDVAGYSRLMDEDEAGTTREVREHREAAQGCPLADSQEARRSGETNRRDASMLARLLRAGEFTAVWAPDADHEAMRDLIRLRSVVRQTMTSAHKHLQGFLSSRGYTATA
jgi:class 3 adenylate cyclase